jgi:hypothetical protein
LSEHDSELSAIYRESPREEPGAKIDAAILAAAHREVKAKPRRLVARSWGIPLSAAAVLVLSATLTLMVLYEPDAPQRIASPPASEAPAAKQVQPGDDERRREAVSDKSEKKAEMPAAPTASPERDAQASKARSDDARFEATPPRESQDKASESESQRAELAGALPRSAPQDQEDTASARVKEETPEQWLARIEKLRAEGKIEEAQKSLAEFKKRYPDYAVPDWAKEE